VREHRSVRASQVEKAEEEEVKEVETPKSNVRNTTKAVARVKRCSRNAARGRTVRGDGRAQEDRGGIFGTLNSNGVQEARYRRSPK
jgi:hypothetical protein